ncbi:MAG: hypothetical protein ACYDAZ_00665 [Thermoplasmataceae archaeon]
MPKTPYVKTEQVNVRLPIGIYDEILRVMNEEKKWNSPQQFIQDALNEKIDRWKREHAEISGHP